MPSQYGPVAVNHQTGAVEYSASVGSGQITDGSIANADIATDAAIAASKLSGVVTQALADAKGDLVAASAADTFARVAVGANNTVLIADDAQAAGVKWASGTHMAHMMITYGPAAAGVGLGLRLYFQRAVTLLSARLSAGTAPTGAGIVAHVLKNNAGTVEDLTIVAGTNTISSSSLDITAMAAGDFLNVWLESVGSGTAGSDVGLDVEYI